MNKKNRDVGLAVLFTFFLLVSGFFNFLAPLPLFYIARRYSWRTSFWAWVGFILCLSGLYFFLFSLIASRASQPEFVYWFFRLPGMVYYPLFGPRAVLGGMITDMVFFSSLSLLLAWKSTHEKKLLSLVGWLLGGSLLVTSLTVFVLSFGDVASLLHGVSKYFQTVLHEVIQLNSSGTGIDGEQFAFLKENSSFLVSLVIKSLPGGIFNLTLLIIVLDLVVARRLMGHLGYFEHLEELNRFFTPFFVVWGVIGSFLLYWLNGVFLHSGAVEFLLINFCSVFFLVYFLQGLAVLSFYFNAKGVNPWLRFLTYLILFFVIQPVGFLLIVLGGFFDSWFNFRKLSFA